MLADKSRTIRQEDALNLNEEISCLLLELPQRRGQLPDYEELEAISVEAKELAAFYNRCPAVTTKPSEPVSNMFHVHIDLPKAKLEPILLHIYETTSVGFARTPVISR